MYPNLYYIFKDWFGVEWKSLGFLNTFGLMVALAFLTAAIVLTAELRRKEKQGILLPREELITVGKPASITEILFNAIIGFLFGYKILGLFLNKPESLTAQEYIFSAEGNLLGGLALAALLGGLKWYDKNKSKLKEPETRTVRIWPHDRVGDIIILGLVFGILGAKLFDNLENWDDFIKAPLSHLFSASGLTFYGGLILAAIAICWFGARKGIKVKHLVDAAAPALMIAYAIGRIGCQVSGDGDWGVFNSAYVSDTNGQVKEADTGEFNARVVKYSTYFLEGKVQDTGNRMLYVTDRTYASVDAVPHRFFKGPFFLPKWLFAYAYPQNVNKDGILMPGISDEHNRVLPLPVFPTPFYETILCSFLFLLLWSIRKAIKTPLVMFGIYLVLNGLERFTIELIRVNKTYSLFGLHPSQAEIISASLALSGVILIFIARRKSSIDE